MIEIGNILGSILQPLYLCIFMIFTKSIKYNRINFIILSIIDYMVIQNIFKFNVNINADLIYLILFYINLKFLFKNDARITDMITYILSFFLMGLFSMIFVMIFGFKIKTIILSNIILLFIITVLRNELPKIEAFYNRFWNKHDFKFLKSVTIRGFSATFTIFTFIILHLWLIYGIIFN